MFLFHGLVMGAWATQVPLLRERLALSPGALGLALFCISAGAIIAMPATSRLAAPFGPGPVIRAGSVLACASFVAAVLAPGQAALCGFLLAFGIGFGTVDVAMNAEAVRVEHRAGKPILGTVHAMWSVGSLAGSAGGAALLSVVSPSVQAAGLACLSVLVIVLAAGWLGDGASVRDAAPASDSRPVPRPWRDEALLLTGVILCMAFAVEGAVADWGGVYLRVVRHVPAAHAALGYSAFSACMVAMRFAGDRVRARLGNAGVLAGAFLAACGIVVVLLAASLPLAMAGFGLAGLGLANVVPALFALAGGHGADANASVGVAATLGYAGVLAGPPLFGAAAQATSLPTAIGLIGALCCAIGCAGVLLGRGTGRHGVRALHAQHTFRHGG